MAGRCRLTAVATCLVLFAPLVLWGDVFRRDTGEVIPGTEGITPGPGVQLDGLDLRHALLRNTDLSEASFEASNLTKADLSRSTLIEANFNGATAGAYYCGSNLTGAKLTRANLTGAFFGAIECATAQLSNADLTNATVTGTHFWGTDLTREQLYSTGSYKEGILDGIDLGEKDLTGWNLSGQDLTGGNFRSAVLTDVDFTGATVAGIDLYYALGFTKEQLYSTRSHRSGNLQEIRFWAHDLSGWNFNGQDLSGSSLRWTTLTNAVLTGASLKNSQLTAAKGLPLALIDSTTLYNQWTVFPDDFDPLVAGLTFAPSPAGDFNADDILDLSDIDRLSAKIRVYVWHDWLNEMYDLNGDGLRNLEDHRIWVKDLKHTWYGDADLDGEFNANDMVRLFAAGKYETESAASWADGEWNGDGIFNSDDFVTAFQDGGYEQGPRTDVATVPEPGGVLLLILGLASVMRRKPTAQNRV